MAQQFFGNDVSLNHYSCFFKIIFGSPFSSVYVPMISNPWRKFKMSMFRHLFFVVVVTTE
ncbi:hypothetical protein B4119_2451 [Parageobacillus caldoxylosilyticus]|uniref:Uncharacterized protein n=1 Tax=Saccharococcus caldoxylosilyticus TaxID=81408 RepID=A0A150L5F1_9BACL|nr:hypothetical protein B4119_2451 [Parageobacillus caldoxylosilyticus]